VKRRSNLQTDRRPARRHSALVSARAVALALTVFSGASAASADSVADFYKGKVIHLVVGFGPGAAYDGFARLYAEFLPKHIPGHPTFVVENKPGAASLIAANYLYSAAPKDGTVIGTINRDMALLAVLDPSNVRFDLRNFTWIGSPSNYGTDGFMLWVRDDVKDADLIPSRKNPTPIEIASTAKGSTSNDIAHLLKDALKLNLKIIDGYQDDSALALAVDKKEAGGAMIGITATNATRPNWLQPGSGMHVVLQFARATRLPMFPNAPTARELATDDQSRAVIELAEEPFLLGFPLLGPPGIPPDRAEALKTAYENLNSDTDYLAQIQKLHFMFSPVGGDDLLATVKKILAAPQPVVDEMKTIRNSEGAQ
jgi:tripartite-type tricarboxylate transporter receptor subunit TctC